MKPNTHPKMQEVVVTCSCGKTFKVRSALESKSMQVELCSACHPFYTGTQKIIEAAGQVDKFRRRYGR